MNLADRDLVIFSPLPPRKSGIAAYTAELLPLLAERRRILVVVERERDMREIPGALVISEPRYRRAGWLHGLPHLYQLGNNLDHAHVYEACLRVPGLVVLHDPVLHHLVEALTLGRGDAEGYEAVMQANYGAAGLRLARLRRAGVFSERQRYLLPLHQQVLDKARGIIVHSEYAARQLRPGFPVPVRVLRHHVSPLVARFVRVDRAMARERLGLPQDLPVLLSLGFVTRPKQVEVVLHALARLRDSGLDFRYVIGGEAETGLAIPELVERLGLGERVRLTGFLPEEDFFLHARAADLLLNLRFPLAGESSGTLARALGMGLPALGYDFGPSAEYPADVVARLPFGRDPVPALAEAMGALLADRPALARRGEQARAFMRAQCSPGHSADTLLRAIEDWL